MKTRINGHEVVFSNSGDRDWPCALRIDGMFIGKFEDLRDAENRAYEVCNRYESRAPQAGKGVAE
jgi:hypothetical protein